MWNAPLFWSVEVSHLLPSSGSLTLAEMGLKRRIKSRMEWVDAGTANWLSLALTTPDKHLCPAVPYPANLTDTFKSMQLFSCILYSTAKHFHFLYSPLTT